MVETMTNGTKPDKDILAFFKPNGFILRGQGVDYYQSKIPPCYPSKGIYFSILMA